MKSKYPNPINVWIVGCLGEDDEALSGSRREIRRRERDQSTSGRLLDLGHRNLHPQVLDIARGGFRGALRKKHNKDKD